MAVHENVKILSAYVRITAGVAGAIVDRFVVRDTTAGRVDELITNTTANIVPDGILAMKPDTVRSDYSGLVACGYVIPDGAEAVIEAGGTIAIGQWCKSDNVGRAVAATTTGDVRIFKAAEPGVVGQKIRGNFFGQSGTTP